MLSRRSASLFAGCVLCMFILGLTACLGGLSTQREIRIGVIAYLQGDHVELAGQPTVNAAQLAIQEVNESGGLEVGARKYQVVLVIEEITDTPEEAVAAAQKLINQENVVVIVGPQFSGDAIPAGEVAEIGGVPMICPIATNPQVTAGRQYVFRMSFVDDFQGSVMARFARQQLGAQSAAVLYDVANAYNRDTAEVFREVFETLGGQVVAFETYITGEQDFSPQLERIREMESEVLFLPNYSNDALLQAQQARQIGIGAVLLGSDGWDQRALPELPEFEGAFMSAHWSVDIEDERTQTFVTAYRQAFNQEPNDTAALTYDAFSILFDVLQSQGKVDPQLIRDGLYNLNPYHGVVRVRHQDGSWHVFESLSNNLLSVPAVSGIVISARNVNDRKQAELQVQRQLERLHALHTIDIAISSSHDLEVMLNVILNQVMMHLNVDAADVLLLNPNLPLLEYVSGRGFRQDGRPHSFTRIGEGFAGQAALERRVVYVPSLMGIDSDNRLDPRLSAEGFVAYYAAPLIAKGQIRGVLEVFQRKPFELDQEKMDFLETLAGQTAIAIDNITLFNDLQRSNLELVLAYDATIEGWSHALDLRDRETEGHTQRVTDLTVRLAGAMGVSEVDVVHMRRGALLHDIGKMGVPDAILHKRGPLTEGEWEIMKKHPVYAYEMLVLIEFLREAIDIPYCHHERWDGKGYPRGLRGDQIPLAARIFAVVDSWDALRSDRPYRSAWPDERVCQHIQSQAGTQFDAQVVRVFLELSADRKWLGVG